MIPPTVSSSTHERRANAYDAQITPQEIADEMMTTCPGVIAMDNK
jgi:hypothetical protein